MCFDAVPGRSSRLWTTRDTTGTVATSHRVAVIPAGPFDIAPAGGCDVVTVNLSAGISAGPFSLAGVAATVVPAARLRRLPVARRGDPEG